MKIKTIVCIILCFSFFVSSCTKDGSEVELKENVDDVQHVYHNVEISE